MAVSSCNKKEDQAPDPYTNFITLNDKDYSITQGITFEYGGNSTTGYNFELILVGSSLDFSDIYNKGIQGKGNVVYF